ncbi:uncharacterized protein LOC106079930 isoform X3 [Biomphalaria glabrata]|uniref:Uncharacterized protein LOC106079930 isoform X3 n=1 Tax=Biomphalaria glabrata TaxID=6526 RepID=A0A9W3AFL4_BIOGL|nr:uncharacterized protein LOC106079930 isoform X3 [Biomphalaria glabrata]
MIFWLLLIIVTETRVARSREPPCLTKDICPCNTYCSEQADYSVKCYPCHSECEPSQGCDGPMSEQCRACKTGYTKQPGFSPCRASTCPVGTYGNQCKNQCHCHKNYLCVQGRCTGGQCERGRTGLPFCLEACPAQTFGLDCRLICHCKDQEDCNKIQGDCPSYQCDGEWDGPGCQRKLPKLYFPPQVLLSKCNNITLRWFSFDETDDIGQGPIGLYKVMMKQMNGDIWFNPVNVTDPDIVTDIQTDRSLKKAHVVSITSGLVADVEYTFRVDIVASEYDKLLKRAVPGEPSKAILYKCDSTPSCPFGTYGNECQNQCHCLNNDLCEQGLCNGGKCERGRTGLPFCLEVCPAQTFGLDCRLICHCKDQEDCNKIQGDCPSYQCDGEWDGPGCQRRLPRLNEPPSVLVSTCNRITLFWLPFDTTVDLGEGPVGLYKVMMKENKQTDFWLNPVNVTDLQPLKEIQTDSTSKMAHVASITSGLLPDVEYTFRVDLVGSEYGKLYSKAVPGLPSKATLHACKGLPKLRQPPRLIKSVCMNLTLEWDAFNESVDIGQGPVGQYMVYILSSQEDPTVAWYNVAQVTHLSGKQSYVTSVISGLREDYEFNFRVDVVGTENAMPLDKWAPGFVARYQNKCEFCPLKTFGAKCDKTCHCIGDQECDKVTGQCPSGRCHPDWYGLDCQKRLPMLIDPPRLQSSACMNITISWNTFNELSDVGQGPIDMYSIYFKPALSDATVSWTNVLNVSSSNSQKYIASIVDGMMPNVEYLFRVDVIGIDQRTENFKSTTGLSTCPILNSCKSRPSGTEVNSVGKYFIFVVAQTSLEGRAQEMRAFVQTYTPLNKTVYVVVLTKRFSSQTNKSRTKSVEVTRNVQFFSMTDLSDAAKQNIAWRDLIFNMFSNNEFGVTLLLEKAAVQLASMTVLPVAGWDVKYVCFGIKESQHVVVLNLKPGNDIIVLCSHSRLSHNFSMSEMFSAVYIDYCTTGSSSDSSFTGLSLSGTHPFGVITVDSLNYYTDFCEDVENFIGKEMPLPLSTFGQEFITIHSRLSDINEVFVVQALHAFTNVTMLKQNQNNSIDSYSFFIQQHLQNVLIEPKKYGTPAARSVVIRSSLPVQVIYVMQPPCPQTKQLVGDVSYTYLMPDHLFYNEYYVGIPAFLGVNVSVMMVILQTAIESLALNGQHLRESIAWENVVAKPGWSFGEKLLSSSSSRITADYLFGCYVYGVAEHKAFLHVAGYKSCFTVTPNMRPSDCLRNLTSRDALAARSKGTPAYDITWQTTVIVHLGLLCSYHILSDLKVKDSLS